MSKILQTLSYVLINTYVLWYSTFFLLNQLFPVNLWLHFFYFPHFGFPLITHKQWKLLPWHFAALFNPLLETFVPNLIFLTRPSLQILAKPRPGYFNFQISGQSLIKGNSHNSRTNDGIDMKLGPVTKLDKRNKITLRKMTMKSIREIMTSLSFFQFMANLEQSRRRILDS